jgi:hypothetical protein
LRPAPSKVPETLFKKKSITNMGWQSDSSSKRVSLASVSPRIQTPVPPTHTKEQNVLKG